MVRKKKEPLTPEQTLLKRLGKYKRAPTIQQLRTRLGSVVGDEWAVECLVTDLMKTGKLRCTNKLFHLPIKLKDPLPW